MNKKPKRRWYQFSLWGLFLIVTLIAVVLGGRIEYLRRSKEFYKLEAKKLEAIILENPKSERVKRQYGIRYHWYMQLARKYQNATFCPWTTVDDTPPKLLRLEQYPEGPVPRSVLEAP